MQSYNAMSCLNSAVESLYYYSTSTAWFYYYQHWQINFAWKIVANNQKFWPSLHYYDSFLEC